MKRLFMLMLIAVLSFGIASVTLAEDAGGKAPAADAGTQAPKKHKKHAKKHKKSAKKEGQAAESTK
jgi:hypothetical protein